MRFPGISRTAIYLPLSTTKLKLFKASDLAHVLSKLLASSLVSNELWWILSYLIIPTCACKLKRPFKEKINDGKISGRFKGNSLIC